MGFRQRNRADTTPADRRELRSRRHEASYKKLTPDELSEVRREASGKYDVPMDAPLTEEQRALVAKWAGMPVSVVKRRPMEGDREDRIHRGHLALIRAAQVYDQDVASFSTIAFNRVLAAVLEAERAEAKKWREVSMGDGSAEWAQPRHGGGLDRMDAKLVAAEVAKLPARLREVVRLRVWEECDVRETAKRIGVSKSRASQLEHQAFSALRVGLRGFGPEVEE